MNNILGRNGIQAAIGYLYRKDVAENILKEFLPGKGFLPVNPVFRRAEFRKILFQIVYNVLKPVPYGFSPRIYRMFPFDFDAEQLKMRISGNREIRRDNPVVIDSFIVYKIAV